MSFKSFCSYLKSLFFLILLQVIDSAIHEDAPHNFLFEGIAGCGEFFLMSVANGLVTKVALLNIFINVEKISAGCTQKPGSLGLRNVEIIIPEAVERGKPVVFGCLYDLEKDDLYQVKWYRGEKEFCRYTRREVPPLQIFPIQGIEVDREGSDAKQLTISATSLAAQGRYTCEVSADAPSFVTAQLHGFMYVVDLPKTYPDLILADLLYKPGMKMKAECISYDSMPPANLSFYINDIPALSEHVWHGVDGGTNGSLWTAYSTLQFVIQKHHIIEFKIRIRCAASIYSIYYKNNAKARDAEGVRTTIAPVTRTQKTTTYPKHRITENNASWNRKILWAVCSIALILYGLHSVG